MHAENSLNNELPSRMERNFITQFRLLSGIKGAILRENGFLTEFVSGYKTSWMNGVLRTNGSVTNLCGQVAETVKNYASPMLWRLGALTSEPQLVRDALSVNGLTPADSEPGMVLDRKQFCLSPSIPEFKVEFVNQKDTVRDYLIPFADAYELSDDVIDHFQHFMTARVENPTSEGWFVGYLGKTPVSTTYYLTDSEVTMIYAVGTLSEFRKRGYARRTMEAAIKHAWQHSDFPIALYASEMGHSLYTSMGFKDLYSLEQYLYSPSAGEF
jgi:GNAT superfamily N-acetyltransferase